MSTNYPYSYINDYRLSPEMEALNQRFFGIKLYSQKEIYNILYTHGVTEDAYEDDKAKNLTKINGDYFDKSTLYGDFFCCKKDGKNFIYKINGEKTEHEFDFFGVKGKLFYTKNGKLGQVFNEKFELIFSCKYDKIETLDNGCFKILENGKYGILDETGEEIIPFEYDEIDFLNKDYRVKKDGKYGILDETGKEIIPCKYDSNVWKYSDKKTITDKEGSVEVEYKIIVYFTEDNGSQGVINDFGEIIIDTGKYSEVSIMKNGNYKVKNIKTKKKGVLSRTGTEILSCEYGDIEILSNGNYKVKKDGKYGILDQTGEEIIPNQYEEISNELIVVINLESISYFSNNLFKNPLERFGKNHSVGTYRVSSGRSLNGVLSNDGKVVIIPLEFDNVYLNVKCYEELENANITYLCIKGSMASEYDLSGNFIKEASYTAKNKCELPDSLVK